VAQTTGNAAEQIDISTKNTDNTRKLLFITKFLKLQIDHAAGDHAGASEHKETQYSKILEIGVSRTYVVFHGKLNSAKSALFAEFSFP